MEVKKEESFFEENQFMDMDPKQTLLEKEEIDENGNRICFYIPFDNEGEDDAVYLGKEKVFPKTAYIYMNPENNAFSSSFFPKSERIHNDSLAFDSPKQAQEWYEEAKRFMDLEEDFDEIFYDCEDKLEELEKEMGKNLDAILENSA